MGDWITDYPHGEFEIGDVVMLNSGGSMLTVVSTDDGDGFIVVAYSDDLGCINFDALPTAAVELVE